MGAMQGRDSGRRAIAQAYAVDALPTVGFFAAVKSSALPGGFLDMFSPSLQRAFRCSTPSCPSHSQIFRSCSGKMLPCGSKAQKDFKHQLLLPSVVTSTGGPSKNSTLGCETSVPALVLSVVLKRCDGDAEGGEGWPSPALNDDLGHLWEGGSKGKSQILAVAMGACWCPGSAASLHQQM